MKTGIELIAIERQEQIEKHGRTVEEDVEYNNIEQLRVAASALLTSSEENGNDGQMPTSWNSFIAIKMCGKSYKDRLIIAGALIAAEIDRLLATED